MLWCNWPTYWMKNCWSALTFTVMTLLQVWEESRYSRQVFLTFLKVITKNEWMNGFLALFTRSEAIQSHAECTPRLETRRRDGTKKIPSAEPDVLINPRAVKTIQPQKRANRNNVTSQDSRHLSFGHLNILWNRYLTHLYGTIACSLRRGLSSIAADSKRPICGDAFMPFFILRSEWWTINSTITVAVN